ncbi:MAG: hypothetical protein ACYC05_15315 [Sulfuricella sp.]
MNHSIEPPRAVRVLTVIAAVFAILLSGVALGLYTSLDPGGADWGISASRDIASAPEEGLARPVLRMNHGTTTNSTTNRTTHRDSVAPCQAGTLPGGQMPGHAPEPCGSLSDTDKQKLLVLLALWRIKS